MEGKLVEVMKIAAGSEVEIRYAFRLGGQYRQDKTQDKTRSILVRLGPYGTGDSF
jgi:hypothetical protein